MKKIALIIAVVASPAYLGVPAACATGKVVTIGTEVTGNLVPWRGLGTSMRFQCLWL